MAPTARFAQVRPNSSIGQAGAILEPFRVVQQSLAKGGAALAPPRMARPAPSEWLAGRCALPRTDVSCGRRRYTDRDVMTHLCMTRVTKLLRVMSCEGFLQVVRGWPSVNRRGVERSVAAGWLRFFGTLVRSCAVL